MHPFKGLNISDSLHLYTQVGVRIETLQAAAGTAKGGTAATLSRGQGRTLACPVVSKSTVRCSLRISL